MILLDTHPIIWFTLGNQSLGRKAQEVVLHSIEEDEAIVSTISYWEASMNAKKVRVVIGRPVKDWATSHLST